MFSIVLLAEARNECLDTALYCEVQKKGLGERFSMVLKNTFEKISENPKFFQKCSEDYRQAGLKPFPFIVLFRIDKHKEVVVVVGIFHTKSHPDK